MARMTSERTRALLRRHGPTAPIWRRRVAILGGAIMIGIVALGFAAAADRAGEAFTGIATRWWWAPLLMTPLGYAAIAWTTARLAPAARGSGIPQVMAATRDPDHAMTGLVSARTVIVKLTLTVVTLFVGASTGREGPTVQVAASIMGYSHRLMAIPLRASVFIAGGAAGVAAAFNTPLAGVAFAIEELAAAYEQRMTLLVMTAVLIAGMVSLGLSGDYVYFGVMRETLNVRETLIAAPRRRSFGRVGRRIVFARGDHNRTDGLRPDRMDARASDAACGSARARRGGNRRRQRTHLGHRLWRGARHNYRG